MVAEQEVSGGAVSGGVGGKPGKGPFRGQLGSPSLPHTSYCISLPL